MALVDLEQPQALVTRPSGLDISVRTGAGSGRTLLSAFDNALQFAGVADFNLVTLSSIIPTGSRVRHVDAPLPGGHGDLLFCVRAEMFADQPGDVAWAGLGWCADETGGGLFVEHHGTSEAQVVEQIELSLGDMNRTRGGGYGPVQMTLASATCTDRPVCALVLAAYRISTWEDPSGEPEAPAQTTQANASNGAPDPTSQDLAAARHSRPDVRVPHPSQLGEATDSRQSHGYAVTSAPSSEPPSSDAEVVQHPSPLSGAPRVSVEKEVDYTTAKRYYRLYRETFASIEDDAVARQVLHESEFLEEMLDPRVHKYVAWDDEERAIGMTTLTCELETVPWIGPGYFQKHYPDHFRRGAVYYFGFALVHPAHQGAQVLQALIEPMANEVLENRGVVAWDMCRINDQRGFGVAYMKLIESMGEVSIATIDQQTYYAATFSGPRKTTSRP